MIISLYSYESRKSCWSLGGRAPVGERTERIRSMFYLRVKLELSNENNLEFKHHPNVAELTLLRGRGDRGLLLPRALEVNLGGVSEETLPRMTCSHLCSSLLLFRDPVLLLLTGSAKLINRRSSGGCGCALYLWNSSVHLEL